MKPGEGKYDRANEKSNKRVVALGMVLIVPLFTGLWLLTGVQKEVRDDYLFLAYEIDDDEARGYVRYRSGSAVILPDAEYPVGFVIIHTEATVARMPSRRYSSRPGKLIGDLYVDQSFYLALSDGEGERYSGSYYRYPEYRSGSPMIDKMDHLIELNEVMSTLDGYSKSGTIGEDRRKELLRLTHDALEEGEHAWVSDAIRSGAYSRSVTGDALKKFLVFGLSALGVVSGLVVVQQILKRGLIQGLWRRSKFMEDDVLR